MIPLFLFSSALSLRTMLTDTTGDAVARLLKNVTFSLPDQHIDQKEGPITIKGTIKNITCGSISMVDFDITSGKSHAIETGFIDLDANGLTLDCSMTMDLVDPSSLTGNMDVSVVYENKEDSSINLRTEFGFNNLGVPNIAAMPGANCTSSLLFAINISQSNWPKFLVPILDRVLKGVLKLEAPTLICDQLRDLVGTNVTGVLKLIAGYVDPILNGTEGPFVPENPPRLPTNVQYVNFEEDFALKVLDWLIDKNVNGKPMIDRLIDLVVPNGVISKSFHISPSANISADFDVELFTLDSLSIFDVLTPVSRIEYPDYHPNNQSLYFHMSLDTLGLNISGTLTNTSSNTTTPFVIGSIVHGLETKVIVQIGLEPLKDITNLPALSIDCILTLSKGSTVQLLDFSIVSLSPTKISSPNGLVVLGDELVEAVEMLYGDTVLSLLHGFCGTTGRSFLNKVLKILNELKPGCDPAPIPSTRKHLSHTYWIETVSSICAVGFIVFLGLAYFIRKKHRKRESPLTEKFLKIDH